MTNLYYIRHLKTPWNKRGLLQGKRDIEIEAIEKCDEIAITENLKLLSRQNIDIVLTSELVRTQQTSVAYGFINFVVEPLLNEFDFGEFEGVSKQIMLDKFAHTWENDLYQLRFGESIDLFEKRLVSFITQYGKYDNLLIFGHGMVGRGLLALTKSGTLKEMNKLEIKNNSILKFEFESTHFT